MRFLLPVLLGLVLFPDSAHAWGPATHVYIGLGVLESLALLPPAIASLLRKHPFDFLYGSIAADISLAKKYVPEGRHCHNWEIGREIYRSADNDQMRAVGIGYLAHLAGDTVAHNTYVPRRLVLTSSTAALGHSYWEHRMDFHLGDQYMRLARRVVMEHDHSAADALFDHVLSATLFSFQTNRRIFRGMIRFQDNDRWQAIFGTVLQNSRWTLNQTQIDTYVVRTFDYVMDYLRRDEDALAAELDPVGDRNLTIAKRVRRMALREGAAQNRSLLKDMANDFFPVAEVPFGYWEKRGTTGEPPPDRIIEEGYSTLASAGR